MRGGSGPPKAARPIKLNFASTNTKSAPRPTSMDRYDKRAAEPAYGPEWERTRQIVLRRDNYTCTNGNCRKVFRPPNHGRLDAHHIVRRENGGPDTANNLRTLCKPCHALEHPHLQRIGYGQPNGKKRKKYR